MQSTDFSEINIAFIGDGGVGKTSYIKRITQNIFEERYINTIGCVKYHIQGKKNSFNIFDFAGQEKYGCNLNVGIDFYIIFFDLNNKLSFKNCDTWFNKIKEQNSEAKIILVATKCDLNRKINKSTIQKYIIKRKIPKYIEISTKSCYNYDKLFQYLDN